MIHAGLASAYAKGLRIISKSPGIRRSQDPGISAESRIAESFLQKRKNNKIKLLAMAHSISEVQKAVSLGAEGIGLARTEIMYQTPERSEWLSNVFLAKTAFERTPLLQKLEKATREEVLGMLRILKGKPLTVRLLDPSLGEILPKDKFHENNPLLGLRGVRLGIVFPEVYGMQIKAILEAGQEAAKEGTPVNLGILVPEISDPGEVLAEKRAFENIKGQIEASGKTKVSCKFGIMLETPRACVMADKLAPYVDFFTIGSNDLTQSTWALSKEDSEGKFLNTYLEKGIISKDPFVHLDREGVAELMKEGISKGKSANPNLEIVLAGEAANDPDTPKLLREIGVDAVASNVGSLKAVQKALDLTASRKTF